MEEYIAIYECPHTGHEIYHKLGIFNSEHDAETSFKNEGIANYGYTIEIITN